MPSTTIELRAKDKTKEAFSSVSKSMKGMKDSLGGLKGALGALIGAAGIGAMVSELRDVADQLGKVSARLGVNAKDLQVFQAAAQKSGMDVNQFNIALQRFTRRTAEAAMGTGEAKGALA